MLGQWYQACMGNPEFGYMYIKLLDAGIMYFKCLIVLTLALLNKLRCHAQLKFSANQIIDPD